MTDNDTHPIDILISGSEDRRKRVLQNCTYLRAAEINDKLREKYGLSVPIDGTAGKIVQELVLQLAEAQVLVKAHEGREHWRGAYEASEGQI